MNIFGVPRWFNRWIQVLGWRHPKDESSLKYYRIYLKGRKDEREEQEERRRQGNAVVAALLDEVAEKKGKQNVPRS